MKTTVEFIDAVRAAHGLTSDYQLAKHLKIRAARISNYRNGHTLFDEETCLLIAADLGLDPGYVFACVAAERANKPEVKAAWKHTAELIYGLAAAFALVAVLPFVALPSYDAGIIAGNAGVVYYVKSLLLSYWWLFAPALIIAALLFPRKPRNETLHH